MSERKPGWYWVKTFDHPRPEYWEVAYWADRGPWQIDPSDGDVQVVGPRILSPDEVEDWQLVPKQHDINMSIAHGETFYSKRRAIDDDDIQDLWEALLTAAPSFGEEP